MSAAAAPGPGIYEDITAENLLVRDIIYDRVDNTDIFAIITRKNNNNDNKILFYLRKLDQINKIFLEEESISQPMPNNKKLSRVNCPPLIQPTAAGAGATTGGSRSRKRSTSRSRRKLRKAA
jgi:hypothetical protein